MPPARDCLPSAAGVWLVLVAALLEFSVLVGINIYVHVGSGPGSVAAILEVCVASRPSAADRCSLFVPYLALDGCWKRNSVQLIAVRTADERTRGGPHSR